MINRINGKMLIRSLIAILFFLFVLNIVHEQNELLFARHSNSVMYEIVPGTLETIEDNMMPISELKNGFSLSSVSLFVGSLIMMVTIYITDRKITVDEGEEKRFGKKAWPRYLAPVPVVMGILLFIVTGNMSYRTVIFDSWTPVYMILAIIEIYIAYVNLLIIRKY